MTDTGQLNRAQQLVQLAGRDIEQDCADYQGLQGLMQCLYEQLLLRNCEQIEQLNQQILVLIEFIRARAERRRKILAAFGIPAAASNQGIVKLLCMLPESMNPLARWSQLESLVSETKRLNERNGKLLAMHNEIINHILGGQQAEQVYSPQYY
ncbi:MAG TPA: flagellar export chaperone FlgN [Cellvibrio sp.]|jgi:flagella synthesis protein FlgN